MAVLFLRSCHGVHFLCSVCNDCPSLHKAHPKELIGQADLLWAKDFQAGFQANAASQAVKDNVHWQTQNILENHIGVLVQI